MIYFINPGPFRFVQKDRGYEWYGPAGDLLLRPVLRKPFLRRMIWTPEIDRFMGVISIFLPP